MILYILLILILFMCNNDNNTTIEYYTNDINPSDMVDINEKKENNYVIDDSVCDSKDKRSLIYTSNDNNNKIKKYLESSQERLNMIVKKYIDDSKVKLSMLPIEQSYLKPEPKDDFILPFDKSINQVSVRNRKYIDNMCTGYWGNWIGKDECKIDTPCKKIYRKWNYNNLGDEEDHDCKTDSSGITNINKEINLKDYKNQTFNIDDPSKYPSNIDVARCDQVINYSQQFNVNDADYKCNDSNNSITDKNSDYKYIFSYNIPNDYLSIISNQSGNKYKRYIKQLKNKISNELNLNNKQRGGMNIDNINIINNNIYMDVYVN